MAAFDVDGYRKAAKAAGISDSEIENEIKFQTSPPAKTDPFEKDEGGFKLSSVEQVNERLGNDWWHLPAGLAAVGLGIYGASKLMGGGPDDPDDPNNKPKYRFDPTFDVEPLPSTQQIGQQSLPQQTNLSAQDIQARAAQLKAATPSAPLVFPQFPPEAAIGGVGVPPSPPYQPLTPLDPGPIARTPLPAGAVNPDLFSSSPKAPVPPVSTPLSAAPGAPAPEPSSKPGSTVTSVVADTVKGLLDDENKPRTLAGELPNMSPAGRSAAEAFAAQYPGYAADLAKEQKFGLLGYGSADNNLFNAYGPELRREILKEVNEGKPGGIYENYSKRINPAIQALPPESPLAKQLEALRVADPKGANRGQLGTTAAVMPDRLVQGSGASKLLKPELLDKAGKAALVMMLANSANAASKGDTAPAKEVGFDLASGAVLAKILGGPASAALTALFGSSGLNANEAQDLAYRQKVGAGRGTTPASAYPR